ncbi:solute carrier family 22 member 20-like [Macrobrachium nipponense]|uniref:solute carrier family 22 member 20-like n=1 Tax=Macrobrachium nipponense TaxID=159736 RepID=UPI0030C8C363
MADDIDAIFTQIGFGNWQLIAITAAILGPAALAPALIGSTLTNAQVPYRCREAGTLNITEGFDNGCSRSSEIVSDVQTAYNTTQWTPTIQETFNNVSCSSWEYDTSVFTSTITMEWGFICEDAWLSSLYQMVISAGCMMGDVVGGAVGDRLGRRATLRYGSLVVVAAVLGIGLLPIYSLVLVCRLVLGLTLSSIIYPTYNLVMETTPTSQRTIVGMILCAPYSVSVMVFAGLGYFLRDWRTLHLTSSIFAFLLLPVSW